MLPDAVRTEQDSGESLERRTSRSAARRAPGWQIPVAVVTVLVAALGLLHVSGLTAKLRPLGLPTAAAPTATQEPTVTPLPTVTATAVPTVTPTPVPTSTPTPVPVLMPGGTAVVKGTEGQQLRLRAGPGLTQETLRILEEGTSLKVLAGPEVADGYKWWQVQTSDGLTGWAAGNWLAPVAP